MTGREEAWAEDPGAAGHRSRPRPELGVTSDQPQGASAEARAPRDSSDFPRPLGEALVWCGSPSGLYICWLGDPFS